MIYAEISDLEAGWRPVASDEVSQAETLLSRASLFLDGVVEQYGIDINEKAEALTIVCCDLVQRKLESNSALPITSLTQTAGAFSETMNYAGRRKSWELYPEDLQLLGVHKRRARVIEAYVEGVDE